jgi:hypothetical protein
MTHQKGCPGSSLAAKLVGNQGTISQQQPEIILALPGTGCKFLRPDQAGETHGE